MKIDEINSNYLLLDNGNSYYYPELAEVVINGISFDEACEILVAESWKDQGQAMFNKQKEFAQNKGTWAMKDVFGDLYPDTRHYAEAFVKNAFYEKTLEKD